MGRFIYNKANINISRPIDESRLRQPEADSDLTGTDFYEIRRQGEPYTTTRAGFRPGKNPKPTADKPSGDTKLSYLKAEIDFMVDGFMRELIDFEALANLDPEIQAEIVNRYPQFFN